MTLVVDASVACKWFVVEEHSDQAESLLSAGESLIAPGLIVPEVSNVAWRKIQRQELTHDQARAMVHGLLEFLDRLVPCGPLSGRALDIAAALGHPAYDCFYLALAESTESRFVTADSRLIGRLAASAWAQKVTALERFTCH